MAQKINFRVIYDRTRELLLHPQREWQKIEEEEDNAKSLFREYILPLGIITSIVVLLLGFLSYTPWQTVFYAFTNFISVTAGTYVAFLITREYLNNRISDSETTALHLTVYSSGIFIIFHSLSIALVSGFLSQLAGLASLLFLRTLYIGIYRMTDLPANYKTNTLVIMTLSIICLPVILTKLFMILFHIPAFNL